jgi:hypothetical protein
MIKNINLICLFIVLALFLNASDGMAQTDGVFFGGGAIPVTVTQDEMGTWHLLRNAKPYEVRGAGGNVQLDKLVEIGGNSIRTWSTDNAQEILDEAYSKGLTVMLGLWVQHERHGFDYNDEKKVAAQLEGFKKVIDEVKKPKRFIVLGSSIGWQCFFWNFLFPDVPVIGVEIHKLRFEFSCYLAEKYQIQNISFINDDIRNMDFENGDLIWENNVCFFDTSDEVNWRVLTRYEDIQIVSYSPILEEHQSKSKLNEILLMDNQGNFKGFTQRILELPASWSEKQTFHII